MNLPAPFGQVTPTPPVVRFVICELGNVFFLHLQKPFQNSFHFCKHCLRVFCQSVKVKWNLELNFFKGLAAIKGLVAFAVEKPLNIIGQSDNSKCVSLS